MQARLEAVEMGNQGDAGDGDVSEPEVEATEEEEVLSVSVEIHSQVLESISADLPRRNEPRRIDRLD